MVTLFIEEKIVTKPLSQLIMDETLLSLTPYFSSSASEPPIVNHDIKNGDYIYLKNDAGELKARALFIELSEINLAYKKYELPKTGSISIGKSPAGNDIAYGLFPHISEIEHAKLWIDETDGSLNINDLKRNKDVVDIYVKGIRTQSGKLELFDEVFIMGLSIIHFGSFIAVRDLELSCRLSEISEFDFREPVKNLDGTKYFVRTPRIPLSIDVDTVEISAPPSPFSIDDTPFILVMGPRFTMAAGTVLSLAGSVVNLMNYGNGGNIGSLITSLSMTFVMLTGAIVWPLLLRRYNIRKFKEKERFRHESYQEYLKEISDDLEERKGKAEELLEKINPSPEELCKLADGALNSDGRRKIETHLWERSPGEEDFLNVRLGLGEPDFNVNISIPKQSFQLYKDELREKPAEISERFRKLSDAPITFDLMNNRLVGIIEYTPQALRKALTNLILNIAALYSYDEVKLVMVLPEREAGYFEYIKNIPHSWSNDKSIRYFAVTKEEVHFVFSSIYDIVKEREAPAANKTGIFHVPHFVIIIMDESLLGNEVLLRYIENPNNTAGISSILAYGDIGKLHKNCGLIIEVSSDTSYYYSKNKNDDNNNSFSFKMDTADDKSAKAFIRDLSRLPVKVDIRSLSIPDGITFLQIYKTGNIDGLEIEKRWNNNASEKSLAVPIGVMAGGALFSLDIHEAYHGCHGLVAGTTGSGKSEFLQSFVLSLAVNYSPKEVAFVLIDFKGGDMARPFMAKETAPALPHLAATVSNLSGNLLYRAKESLDAELKNRQMVLDKAKDVLGVDKLDINAYQKYFKEGKLSAPLPHLIIIVDEFAQLKKQREDFLAELIDVAQLGRSLGIHLILATQKPSGVVDPQIWSNSRFRVCLRVADKQDSFDMLSKHDAAFIKNPGRCYVQVGYDEIYACVQSGYSGVSYIPAETYLPEEEITVSMIDNAAKPIRSKRKDLSDGTQRNNADEKQLEAVVKGLTALGVSRDLFAEKLWKDLLPEKKFLAELDKGERKLLCASAGLADYVKKREQKTLSIDFVKLGHIAVYGASGMGKTTFLQTLIHSMVSPDIGYGYTPDEVQFYVMEFGAKSFGYLEYLPHTGVVIYGDRGQITEFAQLLQTIIETRKQLFAEKSCTTFEGYHNAVKGKERLPAIIIVIDNFSRFHNEMPDLSEKFFGIIGSCRTFGLYFIITGNAKNSIYYKAAEHISAHFTFRLNDPGSYQDIHNIKTPVIPDDIKGRGITAIGKEIVEFQAALAEDKDNESELALALQESYSELKNKWSGKLPKKIEMTGTSLNEQSSSSHVQYAAATAITPAPEAISGDGALVLGRSLTGDAQHGMDLSLDSKLALFADSNAELLNYYRYIIQNARETLNARVILADDNEHLFNVIPEEFPDCEYADTFESFHAMIKEDLYSRKDCTEFIEEKIFVIIANFNRFFDMLTAADKQETAGPREIMSRIIEHFSDARFGLCFITGSNVNDMQSALRNDGLFRALIGKCANKVLCKNSYHKAAAGVDEFPKITAYDPNKIYFCKDERSIAIRQ